MPLRGLKIFSLAALAALLLAPACRAEVRNLTGENRAALEQKVLELRHTELLRISRGRVKANPIILPFFDAYQTLAQDQDLLLSRQLEDYRSALLEMSAAEKDFAAFLATPAGGRAAEIFNARAVASYTLSPRIKKLDSLWLVWRELAVSSAKLQTLPVEYRIALDAGKWLYKISGGAELPADIASRYVSLCSEETSAANVFEADAALNETSAKFSRLLADYAASKQPEARP